MLSRIILLNFQRHRKLVVDFDDQVTVLTGPSDSGKSAILRALRWVLTNKAPKKHIRSGADSVSVILEVDGHEIIRTQSKTLNAYYLDGEEFKAFNRDIPVEIASILKITPANIQRQHDPIFWIGMPPLQLSKELNRIVDLDIIDKSLSNIASKVKKAKFKIELEDKSAESMRVLMKELKWTKKADRLLKQIEEEDQAIISIQSSLEQLESLIDTIRHTVDFRKTGAKRLQLVETMLETAAEIVQLKNESSSIESLVSEIVEEREQQCRLKKDLEKASNDLTRNIRSLKVCPVCGQNINQ